MPRVSVCQARRPYLPADHFFCSISYFSTIFSTLVFFALQLAEGLCGLVHRYESNEFRSTFVQLGRSKPCCLHCKCVRIHALSDHRKHGGGGILTVQHLRCGAVRCQISVAAKTKAQAGSPIVVHLSGHIRYPFVSVFTLPKGILQSDCCKVITAK